MIRIEEDLKLPNGNPMKEAKITITTIKSDQTLKGSFISVCSDDATGAVDIPLYEGIFNIKVKPNKGSISLDEDVEITSATPTPITLTKLVNDYVYVEPEVEE